MAYLSYMKIWLLVRSGTFRVLTKAINHSYAHEWLVPLVCTIEMGCFKPQVALNYAWILTMHGFKSRVDFNHSWSWTTALTSRGPRLQTRVATARKFTHVCAVVTGRYCICLPPVMMNLNICVALKELLVKKSSNVQLQS